MSDENTDAADAAAAATMEIEQLVEKQWNDYLGDEHYLDVILKEHDLTELCISSMEKHGSPLPYTDKDELFMDAVGLAKVCSGKVEELTTTLTDNGEQRDLCSSWIEIFELVLCDEDTTVFGEELSSRICKIALRLARTHPSFFGEPDCFRPPAPNDEGFKGQFHLLPFETTTDISADKAQRHDIVLWAAALDVVGQAWNYMTAESLVALPDPSQHVIKITSGTKTYYVSQKGKNSMSSAIDSMANQPTIYFRCRWAITAVADILGVDMLQYSMPQTTQELQEFNWDNVIVGHWDTYPEAKDPTKEEFQTVKAVHAAVKEEKDKEARQAGLPKSGVQSYCTYQQRWKQWRELLAVFRAMNPIAELSLVDSIAMGCLKLCKSEEKMRAAVDDEVKKHVAKLKRAAAKQAKQLKIAQDLAAAEAAEAKAAADRAAAEAEAKRIQEERLALRTQDFEGTRTQSSRQRQLALEEKEKERQEAQAAAKEAAEKAAAERAEQARLRRLREEEEEDNDEERPSRKKAKRADISRLIKATPRQVAETKGDGWKPPTRTDAGSMEPPGCQWVEGSKRKLALLSTLRGLWREESLVSQPMTFNTVMDFIGADSGDLQLDFNGRVFLYLLALVLVQDRYVSWLSVMNCDVFFVPHPRPLSVALLMLP